MSDQQASLAALLGKKKVVDVHFIVEATDTNWLPSDVLQGFEYKGPGRCLAASCEVVKE